MSTSIVPCRFCLCHDVELAHGVGQQYWAQCVQCSARGPIAPTTADAVERWNVQNSAAPAEKRGNFNSSSCLVILVVFALYILTHFGLYLLFERITG